MDPRDRDINAGLVVGVFCICWALLIAVAVASMMT